MDGPGAGLVKWSPKSSLDRFVHISLQYRFVQLYEPTGYAHKHRFDYSKLNRHCDFPPLTTYDWSPANPSLLAVGTGSGVINILKIDDDTNAYAEIGLNTWRTCQAVSFNTTGLLAAGLDRVRMDQSLHVWDVNRLSSAQQLSKTGFPSDASTFVDSYVRREASVSISSLKFFEDSPLTLVAGIKGQGVRIIDLRDPSGKVMFQTKCNNNLAIDYVDQNNFASSALDHPGVMIWDRRATSEPLVSDLYSKAVEDDVVPWGGALQLDKVIDTDSNPFLTEGKHSLIRSLRFCRDRRGLLATLAPTGQLKVIETKKEIETPGMEPQKSPELLQVQRSHEMDVSFRNNSRRIENRIVSFDWVTLPSLALRPRMLVLRANGTFRILELSSTSADHVYKLIPWQSPHRGLEDNAPYHDVMPFESSQTPVVLGPLLTEKARDAMPIFGPEKANIVDRLNDSLQDSESTPIAVQHVDETSQPLLQTLRSTSTISQKLLSIRTFTKNKQANQQQAKEGQESQTRQEAMPKHLNHWPHEISLASNSLGSCREFHEARLAMLANAKGLSREAQSLIDHSMLFRAKEKYLFNAATNRNVLSDDPWRRFLWDWIADAELAADDGGLLLGNMDLSYLGIHSIWTNDLGKNPATRLASGSSMPDPDQWERAIGQYCKKRQLPDFDGAATNRPFQRQLCVEICGWGEPQRHDPNGLEGEPDVDAPAATHTMVAARHLFRGELEKAIGTLKKASTAYPELLFVSLSLQLLSRSGKQLQPGSNDQLVVDNAIASNTDPYLRAISSLIASGDWATVANQRSLPFSERAFVAVRNFEDEQLTQWLQDNVAFAIGDGDIEGIVLTGITENLVDIFACYVQKFQDVQTATLVLSIAHPRYMDDIRCRAWRNAYRAHLQRHRLFFQRTKFEAESTRRSKRDGIPTLKPPSRQISLRCVYCDAETSLASHGAAPARLNSTLATIEARNPLMATSIRSGLSCPSCGRQLPRCVVCLEIVGVPRFDKPYEDKESTNTAGRFPTFCLRCEHVLHLDHARQWFARHIECPVPECRCQCNFRANPELGYH
ncbi:hypothetical protein E4U55_003092 [Claviceps digitariae]|nr:hypothetical protein E4U55_003092 [Claviceps digitariae]